MGQKFLLSVLLISLVASSTSKAEEVTDPMTGEDRCKASHAIDLMHNLKRDGNPDFTDIVMDQAFACWPTAVDKLIKFKATIEGSEIEAHINKMKDDMASKQVDVTQILYNPRSVDKSAVTQVLADWAVDNNRLGIKLNQYSLEKHNGFFKDSIGRDCSIVVENLAEPLGFYDVISSVFLEQDVAGQDLKKWLTNYRLCQIIDQNKVEIISDSYKEASDKVKVACKVSRFFGFCRE